MNRKLSEKRISELLDDFDDRRYVNPPDVDADSDIDPDETEEPADEDNTIKSINVLASERAPKKDKWGYIEFEEEEGDRGQELLLQEGEVVDSTDSNFTISYDTPPAYKPRMEGIGLGGTQGYDRGKKRQQSETSGKITPKEGILCF